MLQYATYTRGNYWVTSAIFATYHSIDFITFPDVDAVLAVRSQCLSEVVTPGSLLRELDLYRHSLHSISIRELE